MKLARTLGFLGLLPFIFGLMLEFGVVAFGPLWGLKLFAGYSVAILSFLAGAWWGVELKNNFAHAYRQLGAISVCLLAWATLMIGSNQLSLILLALGFVTVLIVDLTANTAHYPSWYRSLRIQLSTIVLALHSLLIFKLA